MLAHLIRGWGLYLVQTSVARHNLAQQLLLEFHGAALSSVVGVKTDQKKLTQQLKQVTVGAHSAQCLIRSESICYVAERPFGVRGVLSPVWIFYRDWYSRKGWCYQTVLRDLLHLLWLFSWAGHIWLENRCNHHQDTPLVTVKNKLLL